MSTVFILSLLLVLMLTGMPISISLDLTVLSFLFFFIQVPIESVALKLFTGIAKFESMAIPFFMLAGNFLAHGGVARHMICFATSMVGWMLSQRSGSITFLLFATLLLAAGNFMELSSIILILAPMLFPIAMKLGIDPIHFGIIMTVNMEIGMCHPPLGLNLYLASCITELTVAVWPWLPKLLGY